MILVSEMTVTAREGLAGDEEDQETMETAPVDDCWEEEKVASFYIPFLLYQHGKKKGKTKFGCSIFPSHKR